MRRFSKEAKFDIGLVPQAINNTNVTGRYFHMGMHPRLTAILLGGAMAATKTSKIELLQAKDAAGTDAKGIPTTAGQLATAEVTANTKVTEATLTLALVAIADAVTINGLTFTAAAAADLPNRVFSQAGDDTADAASLVLAINHETAGVPGVIASSSLGVVTLKALDPIEEVITVTDPAATITVATTQELAFVELDASQLDLAGGFEYVAAKVTTTANTVAGVAIIRDLGRFSPVQAVGASAVV
jgi:hypothetical protein